MFLQFFQAMAVLDSTGTIRTACLVGGILLLIIWFAVVKNFTALFYEKRKIRATVLLGIPGLIMLVVGIFLLATSTPMSAYFYVSNSSDKEGKVEIAGTTTAIPANSWKLVEVRSKEDSYGAKGWLGDSIVFDTTMGDGSYIGSLGGSKTVIAEEVEYSALSFGSGSDDLVYEMIVGAGIARFSESLISDLYDFDSDAPETMSVSSTTSTVRKFDLQLMSDAEMFQMMMEALGRESGEDDGSSSLDSLFDAIGEEEGSEEEGE